MVMFNIEVIPIKREAGLEGFHCIYKHQVTVVYFRHFCFYFRIIFCLYINDSLFARLYLLLVYILLSV